MTNPNPADAVREALPEPVREAISQLVNAANWHEAADHAETIEAHIAELAAQVVHRTPYVEAFFREQERAEQAEAKAEAHAREAAELRRLLVRITDDPVWRTNDETLWPDIRSAIRRGQP